MKTRQKMALARVASRLLLGARATMGLTSRVRTVRSGMVWELDLDEGVDLAVYLLGAFEPRIALACRRLVRPGRTVLDVGANVGAHTLPFAHHVGVEGRVIACEPSDWAFAKLGRNLDLNPALRARTTACQVFLVGNDGAAPSSAYSSWPLVRGSGVHRDHGGRLMATTGARPITLDALAKELELVRLDLVKIDVDGFECSVLRGGTETLARHRPVLLLEVAPYLHEDLGHDLASCLDVLERLGYRATRIGGRRQVPLSLERLRERVPRGASWNVVAQSQVPND